jgi:tRNA1(Val) A37 N6-methylase TrmN6
LLCLAARVADIRGVGVEAVAALAALANDNLARNGFVACRVEEADIAEARRFGPVDHAFANPPWHDPAGTVSPDALRAGARRADVGTEALWCRALAAALRPRGSLTLILPAARCVIWLGALTEAGCGSVALLPLWPRAGQPAKLVILQAIRGGAGPSRVLPGLVLHEAGGYSAAAELVLREGAAISF